mgnify:CR=1 FL=1
MKKLQVICTGGSGFIGTHFVDKLIKENMDFVNIDKNPPIKPDHHTFWEFCNILDFEKLSEIFYGYEPTIVVHLAARAKMEGESLDDFVENIEGTSNVLKAASLTRSISRVIVTSS